MKRSDWLCALGLFVCLGTPLRAWSADEILIGFTPSTSGIEADEAKNLMDALNLGVKQLNAAGGIRGKKVKLIIEDAKSTPAGTLKAYENLIDREHVSAVIGGYKSAQIVAIIPKMLRSGVPTFIGGTAPKLTNDGQWLFRTRPDDSIAAEAMVRYIKDNTKFTKIGVIHDNGAFGQGGANLVEKHCHDLGLTLVKRETFPMGAKDFSAQLKSIRDAGAEVLIVYVANLDETAGIELEHARMGKPFFYLGSPASQAKLTLALAKDAAEGIHAIVDMVFGQTEQSRKYADEFRAEYHEEPDSIAAYTYDGLMLYANAVKAVGEDKSKVRDYLMKLKNYKGVMGTYSFAPHGDGLHAVSIVQMKGGQRKLLKVVSVK